MTFAADPQNGFWLLPSRRRPHNLERFCAALKAQNTTTKGLILIQDIEFIEKELCDAYEALDLPEGWEIVRTHGESQGDKLRETQELYRDGDWVGLIGDDQIVKTPNWDLKIIDWLKGWNLVTCYDDGWQINERGPNEMVETKGRFCGAPAWSGPLFREVGYIFPPGTHHLYLDDAWEELAKLSGCWSFAEHSRPDVEIAHVHFQRGQAPKDSTYMKAYDHWGILDYPYWQKWRVATLPELADRVRKLRLEIEA